MPRFWVAFLGAVDSHAAALVAVPGGADAPVTLDPRPARAVGDIVRVAPIEELS
jgi:hypothetical protein